jgi:hypothetical protein
MLSPMVLTWEKCATGDVNLQQKSCIAPWEVHYKTDRNLTGTDRCPCQSTRQCDNAEIFTIENQRHAVYWQQQAYPVMLVIRTSDGTIRYTNIPEYLQKQGYKKDISR